MATRRTNGLRAEAGLEAIAQPLAALVARAELAAHLERDGEAAELARQLAAMAASVDRLAARIRAAREGLEGTAG